MSSDHTEGVAQDVRAQARAAHAEQHDVGVLLALLAQRDELILFLQHLVGYVEPPKAVPDLLPLGGVRAPQRGVLRPQASRRVVLLQARELLVDRRLQRAEAVPLTRSLPA